MTPQVADRNTGHGHVWPRPDGVKARCGGPNICAQCAIDYARYHDKPAPDPETFAMTPPAEKVAEPFSVTLFAMCVSCDEEAGNETPCSRLTDLRITPDGEPYCMDCWDASPYSTVGAWADAETLEHRLNAAASAPSVAQSERESVATAMIECGLVTGHGDTLGDLLGEMKAQVTEIKADLHAASEAANSMLRDRAEARVSAGSATVDARAAAGETEMNRILALSDEEVIAETIAAGEDPQEVATRGRAMLEAAIVANRERVAAAHAHAISQSNSPFQQALMRVAFTAGAEWQRTYLHTHSAPPALTGDEQDAIRRAAKREKSRGNFGTEAALLAIITRLTP